MHPYKTLPDTAFWSKSISRVNPDQVSPISTVKFVLKHTDKISTAGSCFAQHIAARLSKSGFNYFVTETGNPIFDETILKKFNYGTYSCRYGNIYSTRQLVQLFERAYQIVNYEETIWIKDGFFVDPLRPEIQPNGFSSEIEYNIDKKNHLSSVRKMFEELDVFVFTLGLTECWTDKNSTLVYPICPGVIAGSFSEENHAFINMTVADVEGDLDRFYGLLKSVNPNAKIILTVSPVPLVATASGSHVLQATTYSKSVLRVAAEQISLKYDDVMYFPSYEIITSAFNRGKYYAEDLRSVTSAGVDHVMKVFLQNIANVHVPDGNSEEFPLERVSDVDTVASALQVECEEVSLDESLR